MTITKNKITEALKKHYGNGSVDTTVVLCEHETENFIIVGSFSLWYEMNSDGLHEYTLCFADGNGNDAQIPFCVSADATFKEFVAELCDSYNYNVEVFCEEISEQYPCNDGVRESENELMTWSRI